jgi:prevent-host-death family protein
MPTVNVYEAKTNLSKLLERIEAGQDREIVIARHGKPVAVLCPVSGRKPGKRIGVAKGRFEVPESIDGENAEVARLFRGEGA